MANLLLSSCRGITTTPKIKLNVNQIDCSIRNDFKINSSVYEEFGSYIFGECKNEKNETPPNDYFYKLKGIISTSKFQTERGFGIIFSRKKVANTWKILCKDAFKYENIIIINFYNDDYELIKNGENFLNLVQEKIQTLKASISTPPEKHNLYRKKY